MAALPAASIVAVRLMAGSRPRRRAVAPVIGPAVAIAVATVDRAFVMADTPLETPSDRMFFSMFVVGCMAAIGVGGALAWEVVDARRQRLAVARTIATLGEIPAPGTLGSALAMAIGDPELRIAYVFANPQRYVDARGVPVERPRPAPGRALTTLVRDARPIAIVSHAAGGPDLEHEIGTAVRLGLENERLQAEVLAHLEALRASRARIVEAGDVERRRLERDLHDGAQQRLLALSYDFRVALSSAEGEGDDDAAPLLRQALEGLRRRWPSCGTSLTASIRRSCSRQVSPPPLESLADSAPIR